MNPPNFSIIAAIRTYRTKQDLSFEEACVKAVTFFRKKGWTIPDFFNRKYPEK
jgi:hypothetical protein